VVEQELSEDVRRLILGSVPTLDALELLIGLVRRTPAIMTPDMLHRELGARAIGREAIVRYLQSLQTQGIVAEGPPGLFGYRPANAELDRAVQGLLRAYNERPVTLIRTVYELADQRRIQAFSDAFRIRKDKETG
jgi:hypothetical protein